MATVEWTFLLMNLVPSRGQTFVDNLIAKVFPASSADSFQSLSTEESPEFPYHLRMQWNNFGNDETLRLATRVLLLRFHVKILIALVLSMLLLVVFIFIPPLPIFIILSSLIMYMLLLCSYTAFASWIIITENNILIAVPSWRYRWAIHLNLLFPQIANLLAKSYHHYNFHRYEGRLITKLETPTFQDGSCKILIDYKSGIHLMSDTVIMDHFASSSNIRHALSKIGQNSPDIESGPTIGEPGISSSDDLLAHHPSSDMDIPERTRSTSPKGHMD